MAYLTFIDGPESDEARQEAVKHLLTPDVELETIQIDSPLVQLSEEQIDDIAAYETVPVLPSVVTDSDYLPTTTVCVEAAKRDKPDSRRWIVFTLRYEPPNFGERLQDRWTISRATEIPRPPGDQLASYCASVLSSLPE